MKFRTLTELDPTEGTIHLVDAISRQKHKKGTDLVLVPAPSSDPNDPLSWPSWKKHLAFASVCLFSALSPFSTNGLSPALLVIANEFNVPYSTSGGLIQWCVLTFGLANFIWIPAGLYFGRRPVFILTTMAVFISSIGCAKAKSFTELLGWTMATAICGGSSEGLSAAAINDLYFLHERGSKMGIYVAFLAIGSASGALIAGFMTDAVGWRWFKWMCAILQGINMLMFVFFFPETRFYRGHNPLGQVNAAGTQSSVLPSDTAKEEDIAIHREEIDSERNQNDSAPVTPRKSYLQELNPWSGINPHETLLSLAIRPVPLLAYPACMYATLAYAVSLAPVLMISTVSALILQSPPYLFSVGITGLLNVAVIIGNVVGATTGGWLTDVWVRYVARRNNGIFEPETRLVLLIIPTICAVVGLVLFGVGAQNTLGWPLLYVGYGLTAVSFSASPSVGMLYAVESHYAVADQSLEMINATKNLIAFGLIYSVFPWVKSQGYQKAFGEVAAIFVGITGLAIPLYFYGGKIRHYTSRRWKVISW